MGKYKTKKEALNEELLKALEEYRKKQVALAREIYVNGYDADYIEEHEDLYLYGGHSALQWGAVSLREEGLPFSEIINHYPSRIAYEKKEIDDYCSGGMSGSYPERVITSLLKILDVDFAREQTFPWSKNIKDDDGNISSKRYDFYIPSLSAIIEVHGAQHYEGGFEHLGGRSLSEEQANDKQKCELAKANGIKHYIVINALSSTLEFIKESVVTNQEFNQLFDISEVNWDTVHEGTVVKIKTDVEFPFYEEMEKRCDEWVSVIEKELLPSDYVPLESTKKSLQTEETEELKANIKNAVPSKRGLYPHELAVLKEAPGYHYPLNNQYVPGKWFYDYGIGNLEVYFRKLVDGGFLAVGDVASSVEHSTLPVIKRVLTEHNLPTKGRKAELVELLLSSVSHDELEELYNNAEIRIKRELGLIPQKKQTKNNTSTHTVLQGSKPKTTAQAKPVLQKETPKSTLPKGETIQKKEIPTPKVEVTPSKVDVVQKKAVVVPNFNVKPVQESRIKPQPKIMSKQTQPMMPAKKEKKTVEPTFKNFFKNTKIISRILTGLALFFSIFANFSEESRWLIIVDFMVMFFLPALLTELCSNPAANGSNLRIFKILTNTKVISRVFVYLWVFTALLGAGSIPSNFAFTVPIMGIFFLLPAIVIELKNNPYIKRN